ncbi:hypothetical protein CCANI_02885 [Corynebacterium canis]|nr:hypothetical protein CCANI_02885 [Corynebacterium canis]
MQYTVVSRPMKRKVIAKEDLFAAAHYFPEAE